MNDLRFPPSPHGASPAPGAPAPEAPAPEAPPPEAPPPLPALPAPSPAEHAAFAALLGLVRRLRAPDGCPWDREQTLHTMTPYIVEEAYEVIDAIERSDAPHLGEELGDLLFLLFFCAEIGREEGRIRIEEVLLGHVRKMIARHPHVFLNQSALGAGKAAQQWEEIKQEEGGGRRSVVDGRLPSLPGLTAAYRVQEKAAAVGFDWPDAAAVLPKIEEEVRELQEAMSIAGVATTRAERVREELGDLLFSVVNLSRALGLDAEAALRDATRKFCARFNRMAEKAAREKTPLHEMDLESMEALWVAAKEEERDEERGPRTDTS